MPIDQSGTILIYDEDCFFCSNYVRLLNLRATLGEVTLINARDREKVLGLGFTPSALNEGIILLLGGKTYIGAEAIHHLALLSTSSGIFNNINRTIFKSHALSVLLYPLLKLGRRIYLCLAGKRLID